MTPEETKVVQWFERIDWIQAGGRIAAILVVTFVLMFIARRLIGGLEKFTALHAHDIESKRRAATVSNILRKLATTVIAAIATLAVFNTLGIPIMPFLATAGVAGIAIAFGAQSLVKDFFRGFFLLAGNQIRQGDVVEIAGKSGLVEDVTLRYVQLRDYSGNVHFVPNGDISVVTSSSRTFAYAVVDVLIALDQPVEPVHRPHAGGERAAARARNPGSEDSRGPGDCRHRTVGCERHHPACAPQGPRARAGQREARIPAAAQAAVRRTPHPAAAQHAHDAGQGRPGANSGRARKALPHKKRGGLRSPGAAPRRCGTA